MNEPNETDKTDRLKSEKFLSEVVGNLIAFQERHMKTQDQILRRDLFWRNARAAMLALAFVMGPIIYSFGLNSLLSPKSTNKDYVALVRLEGIIDAESKANAHEINASLREAFEDEKAKGVVLLINSPGGSPVQSSMINERIQSLRVAHPDKTVWVVAEDYMTSGAYFVAVASDNICVNRSSMVGSIGVIISGWGFDKLIKNHDIERRVFTAGANKNRLDMFAELNGTDKEKVETLLSKLHTHFIDSVMEGRQVKLNADPEVLFSGDYWTGEEAFEMGLVDGVCTLTAVLEEEFGVQQFKDYTVPPSIFTNLSSQFGARLQTLLDDRRETRPMYMP
ncbi:MAG: S49 family peptidase [Pseudomonadales bacterium]